MSWKSALSVAAIAAIGYALLELAFVVERNHLLPWGGAHGMLAFLFFVLHALVAGAAVLAGALLVRAFPARFAPAFALFAPIAILVAVHAITFYRERVNVLPRDVMGTLVTLGIAALAFGAAWALARTLRDRPRTARNVALGLAGADRRGRRRSCRDATRP